MYANIIVVISKTKQAADTLSQQYLTPSGAHMVLHLTQQSN